MRLLAIFGVFLLFSSTVMVGQGSYGLTYSFGGSSKGARYDAQAYHGLNSAILSVNSKSTYSRAIITLEDPTPLETLDDFTFAALPLTGCGDVKVTLYIDCNGDGKYKSGTGDITRQYTVYSWDDVGQSEDIWHEIDASCPEIETCSSPSVVRIWITLYRRRNTDGGSCLIDYININGMVASFEPNEGPREKAGKPSKISQNGKITYTREFRITLS